MSDGGYSLPIQTEACLCSEYPLRIVINETQTVQTVCSPDLLTELILGRLVTEGYAQSQKDIRMIDIRPNENLAKVILNRDCRQNELTPLTGIDWEETWIRVFEERLRRDTGLHKLTHSTHACFLMWKRQIVAEVEDIGRHNAVDKAIGIAFRNSIPLGESIIFTTGRMPADMVKKVIRARIPVMVSKESPTAEGLGTAKTYGLTLIGNVKQGQMVLY